MNSIQQLERVEGFVRMDEFDRMKGGRYLEPDTYRRLAEVEKGLDESVPIPFGHAYHKGFLFRASLGGNERFRVAVIHTVVHHPDFPKSAKVGRPDIWVDEDFADPETMQELAEALRAKLPQ